MESDLEALSTIAAHMHHQNIKVECQAKGRAYVAPQSKKTKQTKWKVAKS